MVKKMQEKYGFDSRSYFLIKTSVSEYFEQLAIGQASGRIVIEVSLLGNAKYL